MKIVVDANIFVSSYFWGGNPRKVFERIITELDELYISQEILDEIKDVISRPKFHADMNEIKLYIDSIEEVATKIKVKEKIKIVSRDKNDDKYIKCAISGDVNYIISGDIHLLEIKEYENIKIIKAKEYLDIVSGANGT
jgi:putative PIN family toxin of toxin-antitoxin system